jgi:hypothetical protein
MRFEATLFMYQRFGCISLKCDAPLRCVALNGVVWIGRQIKVLLFVGQATRRVTAGAVTAVGWVGVG